MTQKERAAIRQAIQHLNADRWDEGMELLCGLIGQPTPLAEVAARVKQVALSELAHREPRPFTHAQPPVHCNAKTFYSQPRTLSFRRNGSNIETLGIDFGARIVIHAENGQRMLWKVPGHMAWAGNFQPWKYYGPRYMTVEEIEPGVVQVIRDEQPGRKYASVVREMVAWLEEERASAG